MNLPWAVCLPGSPLTLCTWQGSSWAGFQGKGDHTSVPGILGAQAKRAPLLGVSWSLYLLIPKAQDWSWHCRASQHCALAAPRNTGSSSACWSPSAAACNVPGKAVENGSVPGP